MKRARQRSIRPRNPLATAPLLKKGGAHRRKDKLALRARLKAQALRHRNGE
jgi:hypothetical protein